MLIDIAGFRSKIGKTAHTAVLLAILAGTPLLSNGAAALAQSPDDGEALFQEKCAACHTVGQGDLVGPDLEGVTEERDRDWLTRWISEPDKVLAEQDPIATELLGKYNNIPMPNLGLTDAEVASLVAYLGTLPGSEGGAPVPELISAQATEGDPERGENLFTGPSRFENRGPSCSACHSSSGIGALGGGSLGPDLTGAYAKLGDALITWPESVVPMRPIFAERPLTEQEKADLLAFFRSADITERGTAQVAQLFGLAVAGLAIIAVFTHLIWRRRLRGVRKPMVGGKGPSGPRDTLTLLLATLLVLMVSGTAAGLTIIVVTVT